MSISGLRPDISNSSPTRLAKSDPRPQGPRERGPGADPPGRYRPGGKLLLNACD
jgi:hypothetical protein